MQWGERLLDDTEEGENLFGTLRARGKWQERANRIAVDTDLSSGRSSIISN